MSGRPLDISGHKFGRLTAIRDIGKAPNNRGRFWLCGCDCGNANEVPAGWLRSGNTISCGCAQREAAAKSCVKRSTHGLHNHRISTIHKGMHDRCVNPNNISYPYYGARGIYVCADWFNLAVFAEWAFANGYSDDLTIDRIDNEGIYEPSNCQWSTYQEQARNRSNSTEVSMDGNTRTVAEWAEVSGIGSTTILYRLKAGWDVRTALTRERNRGKKYLG